MHHGRLEAVAQCQKLGVRALAPRTAQDRDAALAIQQRGQAVEILSRRRHNRHRREQTRELDRRRIGCSLQRNIARNHEH